MLHKQDAELKANIESELYLHGQLAMIYYESLDRIMVYKWGEHESLKTLHEEHFRKLMSAGFEHEASTLTLIDLPKDADIIFRILSKRDPKPFLKEIGLIS